MKKKVRKASTLTLDINESIESKATEYVSFGNLKIYKHKATIRYNFLQKMNLQPIFHGILNPLYVAGIRFYSTSTENKLKPVASYLNADIDKVNIMESNKGKSGVYR